MSGGNSAPAGGSTTHDCQDPVATWTGPAEFAVAAALAEAVAHGMGTVGKRVGRDERGSARIVGGVEAAEVPDFGRECESGECERLAVEAVAAGKARWRIGRKQQSVR